MYRQTGVLSDELSGIPALPPELAYLWRWFCDLGGARSSGFSVNPIQWSEMAAYFGLVGARPRRWEIEALRTMDDAYLKSRLSNVDRVMRKAGDLRRAENKRTGNG